MNWALKEYWRFHIEITVSALGEWFPIAVNLSFVDAPFVFDLFELSILLSLLGSGHFFCEVVWAESIQPFIPQLDLLYLDSG